MYLFPQPMRLNEDGGVNSGYIHGDAIDTFTNQLSETMGERDFEEWVALLTYGGQAAAHLLCAGYNNILFCTSYDSNESEALTDGRDAKWDIKGDTGAHMLPIVWKRMNCAGNFFVTMPKRPRSVFEKAYESLGVQTITVDDYYHIDHPKPVKLRAHPSDGFDAVVLLTPKRISARNRKFNVEEVKKDFAKYCKPDFDLITFFEPDNGITLVGEKKVKTAQTIRFTSAQINPARFEQNLRQEKMDVTGAIQVVQSIGYFNLRRFYNKVVQQFRIF